MKTIRCATLGALAGLPLSACTTFDFTDQEILLRHDADEDVLEMVIAYEGVKASDDDEQKIREGADAVDAAPVPLHRAAARGGGPLEALAAGPGVLVHRPSGRGGRRFRHSSFGLYFRPFL